MVDMVTARVGEVVTIDVPSTPSTGYQWALPVVPDGVELVDTGFTPPPAAELGGTGSQHFRVRATRAGTFDVVLVLGRAWEKDSVDTNTVRLEAS
jgi:predicted secreted protein